ncbi:hypothetical protein GCM10011495_24670 [Hymenobacter frigidus]|uniref:Uncharacterized protein n=1 Tax=Hymenobacter frigidus TaxID=1524095 RepID=A0ABQ2A6C1_9BACT|nr:hypothetical protein GCM10011495_24670 [Hymenobacter frigidus]
MEEVDTSADTFTVTEAVSADGAAAGVAAPNKVAPINNEQSDNTFISGIG